MSAERMKPCPFCGSRPTMEPWHGGGPDKVLISCEDEDCWASPTVNGESPSEAVARWNKRAYSVEVSET